jgi:hypothetical protein
LAREHKEKADKPGHDLNGPPLSTRGSWCISLFSIGGADQRFFRKSDELYFGKNSLRGVFKRQSLNIYGGEFNSGSQAALGDPIDGNAAPGKFSYKRPLALSRQRFITLEQDCPEQKEHPL